MTRRRLACWIVLFAAALPFGGCASSGRPSDAVYSPEPLTHSALTDARAVAIFDGASGARIDWADAISRATSADVILVGENHGHPRGLATAAAIWQDLLVTHPSAALALEFFERDEQLALTDYLTGVTDEPAFLKAARRSAGNYPPGHRDMVEHAKAAGGQVIAANAPRRYVRLARTKGYDHLRTLTPSQQSLFHVPEADPAPPYRENFDKVMNSNAGVAPDPAKLAERTAELDASFRSQQLWDWTMADSVAHATGRPVLLVIGRFHIDNNGGTLQAIKRLRPDAKVLTITFVDAQPAPGPALDANDSSRADLIIYVGDEPHRN